jgi:hypothetical protein
VRSGRPVRRRRSKISGGGLICTATYCSTWTEH